MEPHENMRQRTPHRPPDGPPVGHEPRPAGPDHAVRDRPGRRQRVRRRVGWWWRWLRPRLARADFTALFLLAIIAGALWAFGSLADEVMEGDSRAFDRGVILALRHQDDRADPIGPVWFEEAMRDITALGSNTVLFLITIGGAVLLALQKRWRTCVLLVVAVVGGQLMSSLLKTVFSRDRPDLVPHGMEVQTASFPSGHSLMSAVTWLTVATIMAQTLKDRRSKVFVISMAILIAMLVGFSRVYLGVHWPTDVLAGWSVGAAWALMIWLIARWLQQRSQIEPEGGAENEHNAAASPP